MSYGGQARGQGWLTAMRGGTCERNAEEGL